MTEPDFSINFTAKMLATDGCEVGDLLVYNSSTGLWKVATTAARTAADATAQAVARQAYGGSLVGKVTYQSSGVVSAEVSGLGAGAAQLVRTSATGQFERVASYTPGDDIVGYAQTDGRVHLHFGLPWDLIAAAAGGITLPIELDTDDADAHIKYGPDPSGGDYPTVGMARLEDITGDGDNTNDANYQWAVTSQDDADPVYGLGFYANSDGSKDIVDGGRWDWNDGEPRPTGLRIRSVEHIKCPDSRYYIVATGAVLRFPYIGRVATTDATPATVVSLPFGTFVTAGTVWVVGRAAGSKVSVFKFEFAWDSTTIIEANDLDPVFVRKTAGEEAWGCEIDASGAVVVTGAAATNIEWRAVVMGVVA